MREGDIRPADIFNEYLRLSAADAERFLASDQNLAARDCPGCAAGSAEFEFTKNGFDMVRCRACGSLYASAVSSEEQLRAFYRDSKSSDYWARVFFPAVAEARREKIFRPRVGHIAENVPRWAPQQTSPLDRIIDVGAGAGLFLEEAKSAGLARRLGAVEPSPAMAEECRSRGIETFPGFAADAAGDPGWRDSADLVCCFEVIEHVADPLDFFRDLAALAKPRGLVLVTGLSGDGFDILTLGKDAKAVSPPHHLNFLSQAGVAALLQRAGLSLVEFQTPGKLDVDIVANTLAERPDAVTDPFIRKLVTDAPQATKDAFQNFLQQTKLSSHMWIVARRDDPAG